MDSNLTPGDNYGKLVSIIITTYNSANMLLEAITSCLNQSYSNIEIIVIDDGSTDNTDQIVDKLIKENKIQYKYTINNERAAARNYGVSVSKGSYIKFLDADDFLETNYISECISYFKKNTKCDLIHTNCKILDRYNKISLPPKKGISGNVFSKLWEYNDISLSSVIMKKNVFDRFGGFNETRSLSGSEDWEYWVRLSIQNCFFGFINKYLTTIRLHSSNNTMNDINKIVFSAGEAKKILLQKFDVNEKYIRKLDARIIYLQALYFYIDGNMRKSFSYLVKAGITAKYLFFKSYFWTLLIKIVLPQKIIKGIKSMIVK